MQSYPKQQGQKQTASGKESDVENIEKRVKKASVWLLALRVHHAIETCGSKSREEEKELSVLEEFQEVGASKSDALCGKRGEVRARHSWVIPMRGTAEYSAVREIKDVLKSSGELERMSRELVELEEQNKVWMQELESKNKEEGKKLSLSEKTENKKDGDRKGK